MGNIIPFEKRKRKIKDESNSNKKKAQVATKKSNYRVSINATSTK